ncbi:PHA/PHB synthase family protein [Pseudotabrizicola sp. L79]|uniref:PHA/PHB synthase family protein n=1 Tax=Pseudotabrizicola sp. L79 TaxID=3118402 RepID=UPI002F942A01
MCAAQTKTKAKATALAPIPPRPNLPAIAPQQDRHPHQNLDRAARAGFARLSGGVSPHSFVAAWTDWALHLSRSPGRMLELAERAQENAVKLAMLSTAAQADRQEPFTPKSYDTRFGHPGWQKFPFRLWQQAFLATQDWWDYATDPLRGLRQEDADRTRFMSRQMLDLVSPSNFPFANPEIIEATTKTHGRNLAEGTVHFWHDWLQTVTQRHEAPPKGYEIGKDLACTPGEVVFRNELFELIQYTPQTDKVQAEPILIVPAWIMKYYILDLSPQNSMVNYLVGQGFTVFMISWCNPTADQANLSLEDYRKHGVIAALDEIAQIVPEKKIHSVGYCLGGTMLSITAATLAREGDDRLASITLMAAQVDFVEAGELLLFLDESQVAFIEDLMWDQGYLDRPQMARTFATIRSEDLIYSRAVRRYFLGKEDLPSDIGVWNGDTTRMPARMHSEYLRGLFLENRLSAGRFAVEGRVIALQDIAAPMFVVGTETDHIAPWRSVYKTKLFTDCDLTFVLTKGGHNGGIVSEPGHRNRHYRLSHRPPGAHYIGPDAWIGQQEVQEGSWWPAWTEWLRKQSSGSGPCPPMGAARPGCKGRCPAPGTYIFQGWAGLGFCGCQARGVTASRSAKLRARNSPVVR